MIISGTLTDLSTGAQRRFQWQPRPATLYLCPRRPFAYVWDDGSHVYERGKLVDVVNEFPMLLNKLRGRLATVVVAVASPGCGLLEDRRWRKLATSVGPAVLISAGARWFDDCLDAPAKMLRERARVWPIEGPL